MMLLHVVGKGLAYPILLVMYAQVANTEGHMQIFDMEIGLRHCTVPQDRTCVSSVGKFSASFKNALPNVGSSV